MDEGLLGAVPRHQWGLMSLTALGRDCTYEGQLWSPELCWRHFSRLDVGGCFTTPPHTDSASCTLNTVNSALATAL